MGIFSFFSRNKDVEYYVEEAGGAAAKAESAAPDLPELNTGMAVEIMEESGQSMNSGLITSFKNREVTIGRKPGALSFKLSEVGDRKSVV